MRKDWIFAERAGMMGAVLWLEGAKLRLPSSFPVVLRPVGGRALRLASVTLQGLQRPGADFGD
jgi:hypothetical protein